jgi:hypothetical protein
MLGMLKKSLKKEIINQEINKVIEEEPNESSSETTSISTSSSTTSINSYAKVDLLQELSLERAERHNNSIEESSSILTYVYVTYNTLSIYKSIYKSNYLINI